jgi:hypothetical protein
VVASHAFRSHQRRNFERITEAQLGLQMRRRAAGDDFTPTCRGWRRLLASRLGVEEGDGRDRPKALTDDSSCTCAWTGKIQRIPAFSGCAVEVETGSIRMNEPLSLGIYAFAHALLRHVASGKPSPAWQMLVLSPPRRSSGRNLLDSARLGRER